MVTLAESPWEIFFLFYVFLGYILRIFPVETSENLGYVKSVLESKIGIGEGSIHIHFK